MGNRQQRLCTETRGLGPLKSSGCGPVVPHSWGQASDCIEPSEMKEGETSMQLEGCTLRNLVPWTLGLATPEARQVNAQRLGRQAVETGHQNQWAVPWGTSVMDPRMVDQTSCYTEAGMSNSRNLVARLVGCAPWDRHALPHGLLVWQGQSTSRVIKSLLSVTPSFVEWLACPQPWGAGHNALVSWGTACWFWCLVTTIHRPSLCTFTCLASAAASPSFHGTRFLRAQPSSCIDMSPPFIPDGSVQLLAWP